MKRRGSICVAVCLCLLFWVGAAGAQGLKIGVVDIGRLVNQSPQAERAKANMAKQFARRKDTLEAASDKLQQDIGRLKRDGPVMSDEARENLQTGIRDRQRELQLQQSKYNDDVADAEQKEFDRMRDDIHKVIDAYADEEGFDLILGDGVLYSTDAVDVTDEILARLNKR